VYLDTTIRLESKRTFRPAEGEVSGSNLQVHLAVLVASQKFEESNCASYPSQKGINLFMENCSA